MPPSPRSQPAPPADAAHGADAPPAASATPHAERAHRWLADHGDLLWRFALSRTRNRDTAEEILQDTLLAALESIDSYRGGASERAWLLGIAAHKIADHFRRTRKVASLDDVPPTHTTPAAGPGVTGVFTASGFWARRITPWGTDPTNAGETAEILEALRRCLDTLPPSLAELLWLRDLLEVPGEEICKVMSLTPTNLWTRTHRARSALRLCVEKAISPDTADPRPPQPPSAPDRGPREPA